MKIKSFEFNIRELAGSMGDYGTLFPFAVGYIVICGLNPAGFLVMMGLANVVTGLIYGLPMPIEPMKVLGIVAVTEHWKPSLVYASGFAMGITWLLMAVTGIMDRIAKIIPLPVIRGIQAALGILLAIEAVKLISGWWLLGVISIVIVLVLRTNRYAPAAIVLMLMGIIIALVKGQMHIQPPSFQFPPITFFSWQEVWESMVKAGFAQIPLTATNAIIATSALIKKYWPEKPVPEKQLALNMGIMNLVLPFFGGMPLCHGAGGLAGQYFFGARTGGTNIIEGFIEIMMGLFLATSIFTLFSSFPMAIIGAMMLLVGIELTRFVKDIHPGKDLIPMAVTIIGALAGNMFIGFISGILVHYLLIFIVKWKKP
jgi:predicted benzoate:H+ symporter BenE